MEWSPRDMLDSRVVDYCLLCRATEIEARFPDRPGVFAFLDLDMDVLYVGGASSVAGLRERALAARRGPGRGVGVLFAKWLATESDADARDLESDLVSKYSPPLNLPETG